MPAAHVKCYFNGQLLNAIAELSEEERNDPNVITLLPMGWFTLGKVDTRHLLEREPMREPHSTVSYFTMAHTESRKP